MNKIIWAVMAVLILGYFFFQVEENEQKRKLQDAAEEAAEEKERQRVLKEVGQLVASFEANVEWPELLSSGEAYRFQPILTIELERLWKNQSILFLGSVEDIQSSSQDQYQVTLGRNNWQSIEKSFSTEFGLRLTADRILIDNFLARNPGLFEDFGFNNSVAVVAQIDEIESSRILRTEGELDDLKVGVGSLLGIAYVGPFGYRK